MFIVLTEWVGVVSCFGLFGGAIILTCVGPVASFFATCACRFSAVACDLRVILSGFGRHQSIRNSLARQNCCPASI